MFGISRETVEKIKMEYPPGTIHVAWEDGQIIGVIAGEDSLKKCNCLYQNGFIPPLDTHDILNHINKKGGITNDTMHQGRNNLRRFTN